MPSKGWRFLSHRRGWQRQENIHGPRRRIEEERETGDTTRRPRLHPPICCHSGGNTVVAVSERPVNGRSDRRCHSLGRRISPAAEKLEEPPPQPNGGRCLHLSLSISTSISYLSPGLVFLTSRLTWQMRGAGPTSSR